jgi:tetratricopeptide (TPR) repeat protein
MSPPTRSDRPTRWLRRIGVVRSLRAGLMAIMLLPVSSVHGQDRTAGWLEARGFDELLAQHLEIGLEAAVGNAVERSRIAGRLARTYARLLGTEKDEARRAAIVDRSRRIIDIVPPAEVGELQVALVRNRYIRASRIMEDDRIGRAEPAEVAAAVEELAELADQLEMVRRRAVDEAAREARRQRRRVDSRVERQLELGAAAGLIEGWTRYYVGRNTGERRQFELAQSALGAVLQGDSPIPDVAEVSVDLQAIEGFANAMLANAMVTSALDSPSVAAKWFDRLDMSVTNAAVRRATPGWRLASLIDAGDFSTAESMFREMLAADQARGAETLPIAWIRLAAVGALRKASTAAQAMPLGKLAMATLAARGELGQVRGLAADFGLEALGEEGFIFGYVRGLERNQRAIDARESGDEAAAINAFEDSIRLLQAALKESDAEAFADAGNSARLMIGWNLLEVGRTEDAADAFEQVASRVVGRSRSDALWGAIVALDRVVAAGGPRADAAAARRDALSERFLDAFPADDRAPTLVIRRLAMDEKPDEDALSVLLSLPKEHPNWALARRRAVLALYRAFREASDEERTSTGRRMLEVADELLDRDRAGETRSVEGVGLDGLLLRQAAEVASDEDVHEVSRAERYIDRLQSAFDGGAFPDLPDLPNELQYRRLGVALGDGDFARATGLLGDMPVAAATPEASRWLRLAALRVHNAANARMRAGAVRLDVARAGAEAGTRYLELVGGRSDADGETSPSSNAVSDAPPDRFAVLDRERFLPIARRVADARAAMFRTGGDPFDGNEALDWYRALLERRPLDGGLLQEAAELAESLERPEVALDAWRRLVRGALDGEERWWRGKVGQIRVLVETSPATAREVFDQVRTLYPDLGSPPWNQILRELDLRIEVAIERASVDAEDPASESSEDDA